MREGKLTKLNKMNPKISPVPKASVRKHTSVKGTVAQIESRRSSKRTQRVTKTDSV